MAKQNSSESMNAKFNRTYPAKILFEASIDCNGHNYLVIYGKHINGYFCGIPNWGKCCEMAEPSDILYNSEKLRDTGIVKDIAQSLAKCINEIYEAQKGNVSKEKTSCLCDECKYIGIGTPDGDCIYAGLCCYGIAELD